MTVHICHPGTVEADTAHWPVTPGSGGLQGRQDPEIRSLLMHTHAHTHIINEHVNRHTRAINVCIAISE